MRPQHLLLLPLSRIPVIAAHLIRPNLNIRTPTFPETTTAAAFPPAPISPAQILQQCAACQVVGEALAVCLTLTPSFTALQPTAQANCLCYSSRTWSPNIFDNAVQSCANFASTAVPPAYGALSDLENFCENIGDVNKSIPVFTLSSTAGGDTGGLNGGDNTSTSVSNYVAPKSRAVSSSPAITGYGGTVATKTVAEESSNTNVAGPTGPTSATENGGQGYASPSKTISETGITITIGGAGATDTSTANSTIRIPLPKENIIWLAFAFSLLVLFL
ncbi:hypothetical protein EG329_006031 [Mollisiaceae sp. DMI_Dod_QoI]|nr:hypothetical protein EG329_006031 [Helotiales sp. DMI_Dod_QoI]